MFYFSLRWSVNPDVVSSMFRYSPSFRSPQTNPNTHFGCQKECPHLASVASLLGGKSGNRFFERIYIDSHLVVGFGAFHVINSSANVFICLKPHSRRGHQGQISHSLHQISRLDSFVRFSVFYWLCGVGEYEGRRQLRRAHIVRLAKNICSPFYLCITTNAICGGWGKSNEMNKRWAPQRCCSRFPIR